MIGGGSRRRRRTRRRERKRKRWSTRIRGGGGGEETKRTTFSRGRIAEEVQTGLLHLHNRYIPAAWTDVEAESSVSSVRYIARLALARDGRVWRSLSRDRWEEGIKRQKEKERERENEQRGGFEESRREEGGVEAGALGAHSGEAHAVRPKKLARREKSVGASTRRPMTSSELSLTRVILPAEASLFRDCRSQRVRLFPAALVR